MLVRRASRARTVLQTASISKGCVVSSSPGTTVAPVAQRQLSGHLLSTVMQTKDSLRALQYCTSAIGQPLGHLMRYCCSEQALRLLATYRQLGARFCSSAIPIAAGSVGTSPGPVPAGSPRPQRPPCTQKPFAQGGYAHKGYLDISYGQIHRQKHSAKQNSVPGQLVGES